MERRESCEDPYSTAHNETAKTRIESPNVEGAVKGSVCIREQLGHTFLLFKAQATYQRKSCVTVRNNTS